MFDVGFWELALIGVVTLVIVGPERLPGVARTAGLWIGKGRRMLNEVKADVKRELKEQDVADLSAIKRDIQSAGDELKGATEKISESVGAKDIGDSLKKTFQEASPLAKDDQLKAGTDKKSSSSKKRSQKKTVTAGKTTGKSTPSGSKKKAKPRASTSSKVASKGTGSKKTRTTKSAAKKTAAKKGSVNKNKVAKRKTIASKAAESA